MALASLGFQVMDLMAELGNTRGSLINSAIRTIEGIKIAVIPYYGSSNEKGPWSFPVGKQAQGITRFTFSFEDPADGSTETILWLDKVSEE